MLRQLGLHDLLLDQLVESMATRRPSTLGVALGSHGIVLEGDDLSLELLVERFHFLFTEDVVTIERHMFSLAIGLQLFFHLLSHFIEHLKELVFLLMRRLDAGRRLLG